ncbi:hypothetical protein ACIRVF_04880 [Kitasatospora sp. NPDC101157]|uniref:hypothetical protein n=1 Tax=Kitasatospora sp. NPDC101157 TaxID=3364098 RepID=UPI0037F70F51
MSATRLWVIGTVSDEELRQLLGAAAEAGPVAAAPGPAAPGVAAPGVAEELAWWRGVAGESLFGEPAVGGGSAGEDAFRLCAFFDSCRDGSDAVEDLREAVVGRFRPEEKEGLFSAAARKANPFWALAYALGPDATLQLPGWFGDFLLDSRQVRACLPDAEEALTLTGARRREVVERIHAWMTGLGDGPDHDADALLDGPLRVLRHAARTGRGAAGHTLWY